MTATTIYGFAKQLYLEDFETKTVLEKCIDRFKDKKGDLIITPNRVTSARGILLFPGVAMILSGILLIATAYIAVIFWMESLDGLIAKKRDLSTQFGKYYDPAMDKVTELVLLSTFVTQYGLWSITEPSLYLVSVVWYLIAEAALFGISLYKYSIAKGHPTKYIDPEKEGANSFGKTKTFVSFAGTLINIPLLGSEINPDWFAPVYIAAFVLAILSGWKHISVIQTKPA